MLTIPMVKFERNESLYSLLCRAHQMISSSSPFGTLKMATGLRGYKPMSGLPTHINNIAKNLNLPKLPVDIISDHTHFPLYKMFIELPKRALIVNAMLDTGSAKSLLGLLRNHVGAHECLRYCKKCYFDDITNSGFAYWHREHMVPWIYFCPHHRTALTQVDIERAVYGDRALMLPAGGQTATLAKCDSAIEKLITISVDTTHLLNLKNLDAVIINKDAYQLLLNGLGICSQMGRINQHQLMSCVADWLYDLKEMPIFDRLFNALKFKRSWVATMAADHYYFHHPLKHLVLLNSLGLTLEDLVAAASMQVQANFDFTYVKREMPSDAQVRSAIENCGSIRSAAKLLKIDVTTLCCYANKLGISYKHRTQYITQDIVQEILKEAKEGESTANLSRKYGISICSVNRIKRTYLLKV